MFYKIIVTTFFAFAVLQSVRGFCVEDLDYFDISNHAIDALCEVRNIMWEEYEAARKAQGMGTDKCNYNATCQEILSKLHKTMVKVDKEVLIKVLDDVEGQVGPNYDWMINHELVKSIKSQLKPIVTTFSNKCNKYSSFIDDVLGIFNK